MAIKTITSAIICIVATLWVQPIFAQDIWIQYDSREKSFEKDKPLGIKVRKTYTVKILNTHNGIFDTKVVVGNFVQSSNAPEVLKFLSIPSTDVLSLKQEVTAKSLEAEKNVGDFIEKYGTPVINSLGEFVEATETLNKAILSCWESQTCNEDKDKEAAEVIRDKYLGRKEKKKEAVQVISQRLHYLNLVKAVADNHLKDKEVPESFLTLYANFLAGMELAVSDTTAYVNGINLIYDVIGNAEKLTTPPAEKNKKYVNYWANKSFKSDGDLTKITILLISKFTRDTLITQTLPYFTYRQWKFDFSTGFYWNNLVNDSYLMTSYNADSSMVTLRKDYAKEYDIAIGAQLHGSYKFHRSLAVGINLGAAVSPFDGGLRYLTGFHLMIGQYKQVIISGGWSVAKVKRLSDAIPVSPADGNDEILVPAANKDPKLVDQYANGAFIGISYNLNSVFKPIKK